MGAAGSEKEGAPSCGMQGHGPAPWPGWGWSWRLCSSQQSGEGQAGASLLGRWVMAKTLNYPTQCSGCKSSSGCSSLWVLDREVGLWGTHAS